MGRVVSGTCPVNVGTSGKYPPPTDPFLSFGEASRGETLSS